MAFLDTNSRGKLKLKLGVLEFKILNILNLPSFLIYKIISYIKNKNTLFSALHWKNKPTILEINSSTQFKPVFK